MRTRYDVVCVIALASCAWGFGAVGAADDADELVGKIGVEVVKQLLKQSDAGKKIEAIIRQEQGADWDKKLAADKQFKEDLQKKLKEQKGETTAEKFVNLLQELKDKLTPEKLKELEKEKAAGLSWPMCVLFGCK